MTRIHLTDPKINIITFGIKLKNGLNLFYYRIINFRTLKYFSTDTYFYHNFHSETRKHVYIYTHNKAYIYRNNHMSIITNSSSYFVTYVFRANCTRLQLIPRNNKQFFPNALITYNLVINLVTCIQG